MTRRARCHHDGDFYSGRRYFTGTHSPAIIVAVPTRSEAERIERCLAALANQPRRAAMDLAAEWFDEGCYADGLILTTDADSEPKSDWIAANRAAIMQGVDGVAGASELDPDDARLLPDIFHARGRLEAHYESLLTELFSHLDPRPTILGRVTRRNPERALRSLSRRIVRSAVFRVSPLGKTAHWWRRSNEAGCACGTTRRSGLSRPVASRGAPKAASPTRSESDAIFLMPFGIPTSSQLGTPLFEGYGADDCARFTQVACLASRQRGWIGSACSRMTRANCLWASLLRLSGGAGTD
jgi:hypothetical protein